LAALYYFTFRFLITKFNVKTPGRDESSEEENEDKVVSAKDDLSNKAVQVLEALGGKENLEDVEACITRLRVAVRDIKKVDKERIKKLGATGVLEVGGGVQAIFGAKADPLSKKINEIIGRD